MSAERMANLAHELAELALQTALTKESRPMPIGLVTVEMAAQLLGVSVSWVREATQRGELPFVQLGRLCRYSPESLMQWCKERESYGRQ